ncbi:hypothetical protein [Herbaspirillum frisingense]|uniref:DUF932 domain-containing protein n=1 Tax=Herbaspirillum frisingense TaxID=92645 RepID=A0ABU1PIA1_9BURK|nr:hypothetical protein [Herbaspirillum frisingense]MDR6585672.1 hypothetical protein [Herbaspirillum frisingense]
MDTKKPVGSRANDVPANDDRKFVRKTIQVDSGDSKPFEFTTRVYDEPVNLRRDRLPARTHYPLETAAQIAACSQQDLLHFGGLGKIRLLFPAPDGQTVFYSDTYGYDRVESMNAPNLLVLSTADCQKIELNGTTMQSDFTAGYQSGFKGDLIFRLPLDHTGTKVRGRIWQTVGEAGLAVKNTIDISRIFVAAEDLARFLDLNGHQEERSSLDAVRSAEPDVPVSADIGFTDTMSKAFNPPFNNKSELLNRLIQAAHKFWAGADLDDTDTYPNTTEIRIWLEKQGFSGSLADKGASIIRPENAKKGRRGLS